jgi:hypothetical protein
MLFGSIQASIANWVENKALYGHLKDLSDSEIAAWTTRCAVNHHYLETCSSCGLRGNGCRQSHRGPYCCFRYQTSVQVYSEGC